ncbi:MAG: LPD23 domain-containing protein, partial [Campylobacter sp.]|nr:LPD23 domain-containing protein [Campylobacter sp.]
ENLLKMRENTKASELKGDTVGGSKPTVFYEPQSERYLRTQGGGGLPNSERSITITKADVAKLRADKANEALATKLENNLEALTGDPAASGLIDDLLTRDYHLASAAKKSELVAPKNADEVSGNSRTPSDEVAKVAENPQGNFEIASYKEKKEILAATPMEQWSKEQKEFFDDMPSFQKDEILEASKIKHDEEVFGKIPYNELSDRNKRKVIDEARFSAKGKELQAQYDKLQSAKYTAGAGGKYPSSQQLAKITKTQNKITAQRDELINAYIKEYDEKVARNSRSAGDEVAKTAENSRILDKIKALADNEPDQALAKKIKEFSPQEIIRHDPYDKEPITPETYGHYFSTLLFVNRHNYPNDIYKNPILHYELDRFNMELPRQGLSNGKYLNPDDLVRLDDILLYRTLGSEEKIKAYYSDPDLLISGRRKIERAYLVHPIKEFGTNYAEFYHAGGDAVKKLLAEKQGQVVGAFYDERFGDVGIVWGAEGTAKSDGWGIAKIAKYHPEALEKMEEMLKMPIIAQSENRIKLSDGKYFMSIRKDFNGQKQNWVLTAFEKEESKSASGRRTNLSATQSASEKTTSQNTHTKNSSKDEIKSQEQLSAGLKRGFSTQALNELMLGLGSGGANAMAEDDPNKKAQAFIKGFLAGFGGAKAAKMLAKNAPKLAPQLARASEKMASDLPRLLNDRPDILGGVLGRMNNAKDKFSFIFGGEKALGANKAKLEKARDMAKNGVKDDEIWAKTGWYKDIDGKWKFEINPKGGDSKIFSDEISTIEGEIGTIADQRLAQIEGKKLGEILKDDKLFASYPMLKNIKISAETKNYAGSFKGDEITLNLSLKGDELKSSLYHEIQHAVQDIEGFAKGTSPENINFQSFKEWQELKAQALQKTREINKDKMAKMSDAERIIFDDNLQNYARNKANEQMYLRSAGEAESRNVETRQAMLKTADKEAEKIVQMIKDPKKAMAVSRDLANVDDFVRLSHGNYKVGAKHINLRHTSDPKKLGYVRDDEISRLGENMRKFLLKHKEPYLKDNKFVYEWAENGNAYTLVTDSRSLSKPDIFNPTSKTLRAPATDSRSLQLAPFNRVGTPAKDEIITFYSNRNLKTNGAYKFTNPELTWQKATLPNSQLPHPDKTLDIAPNERIVSFDNSAELAMRESFSPELKASYDMRDKLLKSTNEVRASLNEKGKAELEKLAGSKDSKLSRDAQIMKTLENAKSNPARYAKLKKLYLDENGKVKDSIGLC